MQHFATGRLSRDQFARLQDAAIQTPSGASRQTESPVITDGSRRNPASPRIRSTGSRTSHPTASLSLSPTDTLAAPPADRRPSATDVRRLIPRERPSARHVPVKQAVIAASALSLLYPEDGIEGYSREAFLKDLVREAETDIRRCLAKGAHVVQVDFTEGRLAVKFDPTLGLLRMFVDLNNQVLPALHAGRAGEDRRPHLSGRRPRLDPQRRRGLLAISPTLFELKATNFYIQCASEPTRQRAAPHQGACQARPANFLGVTDPIDPKVETPEEVRDRVLEAAEYIRSTGSARLTTAGFAPFSDDTSTGPRDGVRQNPRRAWPARAGGPCAAGVMTPCPSG